MGFLLLITTIGLAMQQPGPAPPAPGQSGAIRVIVRLPGTSIPIPDVEVTIAGPQALGTSRPQAPGTISLSALTNAAGSVDFDNLPLGAYTMRAEREGYIGSSPGSDSTRIAPGFASGLLPLVSPSADPQSIVLYLRPAGSISGRVKDASGRPIPNARVSAGIRGYGFGPSTFLQGPTVTTDAQGEYSLKRLGPGEYYIHLEPLPPSNLGVYYPGAVEPRNAASVPIRGREDITGIDLNVPELRTFRISGTVTNVPVRIRPDGQREDSVRSLTFARADGDNPNWGDPAPLLNRIQDSNGRFEIAGIPAGSWDLFPVIPLSEGQPGPGQAGPPRMYATGRTRVDVADGDIENITIAVGSADVKGRVTVKGTLPATRSASPPIRVILLPQDTPSLLVAGEPLDQAVDSNGEFVFRAVPPGSYRFRVCCLLRLYVSDVRLGERSIYDEGILPVGIDPMAPVQIDLSTGGGLIQGFLDESTDTSRGDYTPPRIVLVPQSLSQRENLLLYKTTTLIGAPGVFTFRDVAPGNYKVIAWKHLPPGAEFNPEFVGRYEGRGVSVSVKAGEAVNLKVQLIPAGY